ncbi:hypothetical protein K2173_010798 [Erythroxylum novogranatense]|uniref:Uncharacterized protein n=1 Tax=Erythroxylum novogranatense TaxID=1862640 RepID=A0AAV8SZQ4_9ROSI|nr:hypothetical protein K2173_010798 [Erythroxylum novogranatense]
MIVAQSLNFKCTFKPQKPPLTSIATSIIKATIPARDRVIDFGKYKGKMLGSLPSTYLKWVSNNLRAGDSLHWANMADQVLQDPVYKDRLEWEYADTVLNGEKSGGSLLAKGREDAVSQLLEISETFGWDNNDKVGWSKVNFELLGTSRGGRIPRMVSSSSDEKEERKVSVAKMVEGERVLSGSEERRRVRRERVRLKKSGSDVKEKFGVVQGSHGNEIDRVKQQRRDHVGDDDGDSMVQQFKNPFPGREALLEKMLDRKRVI